MTKTKTTYCINCIHLKVCERRLLVEELILKVKELDDHKVRMNTAIVCNDWQYKHKTGGKKK